MLLCALLIINYVTAKDAVRWSLELCIENRNKHNEPTEDAYSGTLGSADEVFFGG